MPRSKICVKAPVEYLFSMACSGAYVVQIMHCSF